MLILICIHSQPKKQTQTKILAVFFLLNEGPKLIFGLGIDPEGERLFPLHQTEKYGLELQEMMEHKQCLGHS